jgi:hypothetical protein
MRWAGPAWLRALARILALPWAKPTGGASVIEREYPHFVYAKMWEAIQPIARGERYEDPLQAALEAAGLGEISGGGSSIDKENGIRYVGVDIDLASLDELDLVKRVLEDAGAPKGSELQFERGDESQVVPFGVTERVTLWLDGITLPDEVYERFSTDDLGDQIEAAMAFDPTAEIRGSWQGPRETAIYIHGADAEALYRALEPVLSASPACQNARVIVRDGNPALNPREERLPMHRSEQERT